MTTPFQPHDLMAILDGIHDAVVKLNSQAIYVGINRAAAEIFRELGRDPVTMIGKSVWELFPEMRETVVETELKHALENQAPIHYEVYFPPANRWYETHGYPSQEGVILIFRDITSRKR